MLSSQVGLELGQMLTNLGVIDGYSVSQKQSRVNGHARIWDPSSSLSTSADADGYPAMYLNLHLNWSKHQPLYSSTQLAAAPSTSRAAGSSSSRISTPGFTHPMSLNSPTPDHVKIVSKPSHVRWMSLQQLLTARSQAPPGLYLLSTNQGLMTDIDAELRGIGGIVLGRLGLPLGHVVQLRGLLTAKYKQEKAAAVTAATAAGRHTITAAHHPQQHQQPLLRINHRPLSQWDGRHAAGVLVAGRLQQLALQDPLAGKSYMEEVVLAGPQEQERQEQSHESRKRINQLRLQEFMWRQYGADHPQQQQQQQGQQPRGRRDGSRQQRSEDAAGEAHSSSSSSGNSGRRNRRG